jgi:quinol-cytochrome oxidoreductase complex cytochrome b subunit
VLLGVEAITGVLLSFYYLPTPESAHASVGTIMRDVHFGWLVHQVHFWGAQLLIAILIVRLLRFLVARVFDPPRELFWVLGAMLLLVCFHIDMSGRILPWTADAYWSGVRALEIVQSVPIYGHAAAFVLGVEETAVSSLTLIRAYVMHVGVLPAMALVLIYLHFSSVRRVGLTGTGEIRYAGHHLLKRHAINLALLVVLILGVLVSLAILTPTTYEPEADPFSTLPGVGPAWYLLAPFGFLELTSAALPQWFAGLLLFFAFMVFLVLPFLRLGGRRGATGTVSLVVTLVLLVAWLALTFYGAQVV